MLAPDIVAIAAKSRVGAGADNAPNDAQTIVAIEDGTGFELHVVTVDTYGEEKRQVFCEKEYQAVKETLDPFIEKILATSCREVPCRGLSGRLPDHSRIG